MSGLRKMTKEENDDLCDDLCRTFGLPTSDDKKRKKSTVNHDPRWRELLMFYGNLDLVYTAPSKRRGRRSFIIYNGTFSIGEGTTMCAALNRAMRTMKKEKAAP